MILKTIGCLFHARRSHVCHFIPICEFILELLSANTQIGAELLIFRPVRLWNCTDDLEITWFIASMFLVECIGSVYAPLMLVVLEGKIKEPDSHKAFMRFVLSSWNLTMKDQHKSIPKTIEILTKVFCTSGLNLVILPWMGECGQAQSGVNLTLKVKINYPPPPPQTKKQTNKQTIGVLTEVFCTYDPNLVTLARRGDELWHGQARGWCTHTHRHIDRCRQGRYPKVKTGLR